MTNVAIVTHGNLKANKLFFLFSGRDGSLERFHLLQNALFKAMHRFGTADTFVPSDVDVLIFHDLHSELGVVLRIIKANPQVRLIYIPNEPFIVSPMHDETILPKLPLDALLTWNDNITDQVLHVIKCNIGQPRIIATTIPVVPFSDRKLISCIYSNKSSHVKNALYSERLKSIKSFSSKPHGIDLYGMGWETSNLPYVKASFQGSCKSKKAVLQLYKFSIAFENVAGIPGLITEKIFDCFAAGTVPIYYGAPNIQDYIPDTCFVDFRKFRNYDELYSHLISITEEEYQKYLDAAQQFIESPVYFEFTSARYVEVVMSQLKRLEAMPPKTRSVMSMKWHILGLMLRCSSFWTEIRRFRHLILDIVTVW